MELIEDLTHEATSVVDEGPEAALSETIGDEIPVEHPEPAGYIPVHQPYIVPTAPIPFPILLPAPRREYLRPSYANAFRCIASACEDTCCQGWSIPIDRGTYEKYAANEMLQPHLGNTIILNQTGATPRDHARIQTTLGSACSFLGEDRLCTIQRQLGPAMLSDTCATYPRALSTHAGVPETALNLSCPEAARLTLLQTNLLVDERAQTWGDSRYTSFLSEALPGLRQDDTVDFDPRLAIREFALLLVSDQSYPLWQRLFLLGTMTRRLQSLADTGSAAEFASAHPAKITALLAETARIVSHGGMRDVMREIAIDPGEQLSLILQVVRMRVTHSGVGARFTQCVEEFELGIGCATAENEQQILDNYHEGYRRYYRPLMERNPHILENYAANYIFKHGYPFAAKTPTAPSGASETDASREHLLLCVHLAVVQTLLIGMAAHRKQAFDLADVVRLVQSVAKTIEHSRPFLTLINEWIDSRNLNSSRGMVLLLRQNDEPLGPMLV